jgi:superfamily II DNA or RNA helicase
MAQGNEMLNENSPYEPDDLKQQIETEKKEEVGTKVAEGILKISSIDKEYRALQKRAKASLFQYQEERSSIGLRPYQQEAIEKLDKLLTEKFSTVAVQLPTGSGKTFLIHSYLYESFLKKSKNVLIVTPSWEIAHQHAATMCQGFRDGAKRVRRLGGRGQLISSFEEYRPGDKGKVIITTSALFYARQSKLRDSLQAQLAVIDEGHYGWKKKRLNSIQSFAREIGAPTVLLTATPPQNMEQLPFAAQLRYLDLVPEYLVKCRVVRLETGEEFDPVVRNGVLSQKSRAELSSRQGRFEKIVADSLPHIKGQTIYYAGSVDEAMGTVKEFSKHGLSAVVVHSKWSSKCDQINALAIEKFRKGEVQVLVNVQMLAMGFDVPNVETIIVARPVESDSLFTQMVGRGARPAPDKTEFLLIDVHDVISKPDVAKMFEHKNLFYHDAGTPEEIVPEPVAEEAIEEPAVSTEPFLPLRDSAQEPLCFAKFHFLRSQKLLDCFIGDQPLKFVS